MQIGLTNLGLISKQNGTNVPVLPSFVLLETGDFILLESSDKIIKETP